ncbi:ATPase [Leptospira gomenensis]|uniref:ATPase n=1 Tax=Leptospira gomenensis TaxID=2484974 RepID=A0A5F1YIB1_9LEPT|nr:SRPBCC domain-containing protein [Leptospira gomenensis]TGK38203.1 ATPase [Leptospira gomenensis]TGK38429.1 ATPase [Leptospira gomenensis]TGK52243.1 ATPase [Leptospira gomenensis]TGK55770.1 ATPase [Leptospira gomenensis]
MKADQKEVKIELRGETEVVLTRYFAAPRTLVFDCFTKPELILRWLTGPEGWKLETCENDLKVGGKYLYVFADTKGNRMGIYGKFLEVIVPEKVTNDENYATDMSSFKPDGPENPDATVESRTFTTEGDGTLLTHVFKYASAEIRELESGAAEGWIPLCLELDKLLLEIG